MRANPKIEHIVVLMMENRSFDHILGYLARENAAIDGIVGNDYMNRDASGEPHRTTDGAEYQGQLIADPGHDVDDVYFQMFDVPFDTPAGGPNMSGFAQSYEQQGGDPQDIMRCFLPEQVPNTVALARHYAVCNRWFSSVAGPTLPNRAFAHFGTSLGRLDMSPVYFSQKASIYQRLRKAGVQSKIYYYSQATGGTMGLTFLFTNQRDFFGLWGDFQDACKHNRLPQYSFVEPPYHDDGAVIAADQHPDHNVQAGDNFIRQVYEAIRSNNDTWHSTLFLVMWDEHGGIFDHVAPPKVEHPDGFTSTAPVYDFAYYGVRVPALAISPYIEKGTVSQTLFEHASLPATATAQFIGDPKVNAPYAREQWANTLLALLTRDAPRDELPDWAANPVHLEPADVSSAANPAAALHLDHVAEVHAVLQQTNPTLAAQMDPAAVKTEGDAAQFVAKAMAAIHPEGAPQTAAEGRP
jgi:phospholipase C